MQTADKTYKSLKLTDVTAFFAKKREYNTSAHLSEHLHNVAPKLKIKPSGYILKKAQIAHPRISVVIPCYNTEAYIKQCLDSLLKQDIADLEIFVIDDSSKDETLNILLQYAQNDKRITLITLLKQSGSPGKARNIGMSLAQGRYIYFLDSDDWLEPDTLKKLLDTAEVNDSEICFLSGFMNHVEDSCTKRYYKKPVMENTSRLKGFHESFMLWDKLWCINFLKKNKLKIAHTSASEELLFILKAYYLAKKVSVSAGNYGYNYRRLNASSITKNIRSNIYPSFEFEAWRLVDEWLAKDDVSTNYRYIVSLRKILSFTYAISIVHEKHYEKFIHEAGDYLTGILGNDVSEIAKQLNYIDQIKKLSALIPAITTQLESSTTAIVTDRNILFGPDWSASNPYQTLLYKAMRTAHGCYATGFSPKQLTKDYLSSKRISNSVLHLHWLHPFYDSCSMDTATEFVATLRHAKKLGYTIVWTAHNVMPHDMSAETEPCHSYVRQAVLEYCDIVIAHDEKTIEALAQKFTFDVGKSAIAPHGLYEKSLSHKPGLKKGIRENLGIAQDRFTLLLAGRIRGYKGIERALEIFINGKRRVSKFCTLLIAGYPDDAIIDEKILKAAAENCHIKYVRGTISDEDLEALFIASDTCLLPYEKSATSGLAFLSISYRKPLITSNLPAFHQFIADGMGICGADNEEIEAAIDYVAHSYYSNNLANVFSSLTQRDLTYLEWNTIVKLPAYTTIFQ